MKSNPTENDVPDISKWPASQPSKASESESESESDVTEGNNSTENDTGDIIGSPGSQASSKEPESDDTTRPRFSYSQLLMQALMSTENKQLTLQQIYNYITLNFPYYRQFDTWKVSRKL